VFIGVDASFKHDSTAICVVSFDQSRQQVRLVTHKVFQPTFERPLDFELTVEAALLNMARSYQVQKCLFDPWQMQAVAQRLQKQGLPVEEFPQTSPNLTAASQNLFDLVESQGLVMYADEQMRLAIFRAVAIETPRGWRIGKQNQAHRVDLVISLAMACHAATQGQKEPFFDRSWSWVTGQPIGGDALTDAERGERRRQESELVPKSVDQLFGSTRRVCFRPAIRTDLNMRHTKQSGAPPTSLCARPSANCSASRRCATSPREDARQD